MNNWVGIPKAAKRSKSIEKVTDLNAEIFVPEHEKPVFGKEKIIQKLHRIEPRIQR